MQDTNTTTTHRIQKYQLLGEILKYIYHNKTHDKRSALK